MQTLTLLAGDGGTSSVELAEAPAFTRPTDPLRSRVAYAAAHVVPRATAENVPGAPADIDWDATLAFRHHVWSWGLGVADAMDTAQRNMGLDASATRELCHARAVCLEGLGWAGLGWSQGCGSGCGWAGPGQWLGSGLG